MPSPTQVVTDFIERLGTPGGFADAVRTCFTERTRYLNVGMTDTTGIEEALGVVQMFEQGMGMSYLKVDMLAIAEQGNTVLTERIDHLHAADGSLVMSVPLAGIFEVEDGKIVGWRDYFDTAGLAGGGNGDG